MRWFAWFAEHRSPGRRFAVFFTVAALIGIPAGALRILCVGNTCEVRAEATSNTPFCSLPDDVRSLVENGFYEGRSPDIMAVTGPTLISGGDAFRDYSSAPLWPSTSLQDSGRVPVVLAGTGVAQRARVPSGTGLDDVSETVAAIIGLSRPHPNVRSGRAVEGVASGKVPRLVLEVVLKGIGSGEIERHPDAWPALKRLMNEGVATMDAVVGSLPLDPSATIATLGTGGLPNQHGIIGKLLRNDRISYFGETNANKKPDGDVLRAWTKGAPISVIATLADHLDEEGRQKPVIGLVGTEFFDRGLIGGTWYPDGDHDAVAILDRNASVDKQVDAARALLSEENFGRDDITDLAGVVLSGRQRELDAGLSRLMERAKEVSRRSVTFVITATGQSDSNASSSVVHADVFRGWLERAITAPEAVIEAVVPGGLYLEQRALARLKLSDDVVLRELLRMRAGDGDRLMSDAFPAIAIALGRYC